MPRFAFALAALLAAARCGSAAGPFDELLRYVPPETNTLVLVDVQTAYAAPLAKAEKWAAEYYSRYKSGVGFLPPDGRAVVIASRVNLTSMARDHQIGLVRVTGFPTTQFLVDREGGTADRILDRGVVLSPRDVYITTLDGPTVATVYPADRQATARWLRHATAAKAADLSPYLKGVAAAAGENAVTVGVDLTDSVDPTLLKIGLAASPVVVRHKVEDVGRLARFVASARGLTFSARITDAITATVRVDFQYETLAHRKVLKDLFLELLGDQGVAIGGMEAWGAKFGDTSMTLTGPLTTAELRRVMSLFAFPGAGGDRSKAAGSEVTAGATRRYWAAVDTILADLGRKKDSPDFNKTATWQEKAAAQITQLNRMGVDPIAVEAADQAARRVRAIAVTLRGLPVDLDAIGRKAYYYSTPNYGVGFSWWGLRPTLYVGPGHVTTNYAQVRADQAQAVAASEKKRITLAGQIDEIMSDARQKLNAKYKGGF
jgi:hypothetical protein